MQEYKLKIIFICQKLKNFLIKNLEFYFSILISYQFFIIAVMCGETLKMMKEFKGSQNYKNEPQELFLMLHFSHPQGNSLKI